MSNDLFAPNQSTYQLLTNVLMQQLQLVALLAQFDAQQIAHREHADPLLAINNRQMPAADLLHALKRLLRSLVTANHGANRARDLPELQGRRIAPQHDDPIQQI